MKNIKVGIVGAGPSGLTLAFHLNRLGVDFQVIDKAKVIGNSWREMPEHMKLVSFWFTNCLVKDFLSDYAKYHVTSKEELISHLQKLSDNFSHKLRFNSNVKSIIQNSDKVELSIDGSIEVFDCVVDCTGYFSYPDIPEVFKNSSVKTIHYSDFKNKDLWKIYKNILIVGKRLSAGQILVELDKNQSHNLFLSTRSKIKYGPPPFVFNFLLKYSFYFESFLVKIGLGKIMKIDVKIDFITKKLILEKVKGYGEVKNIKEDRIIFDDNQSEKIDLIILSTGYKKNVLLSSDFPYRDDKNDRIYYLGLDNLRTFRSRFLRGIREDAYELANNIFKRFGENGS